MKNRWLLNLALVLIIGLLAALVIVKPGMKAEKGTPLTGLTADGIQRIRLVRPKRPEILLEKSGDSWRIKAPRSARANDFRVNELLRLAGERVKTRFPSVPAELGKFGLATPFATVFLDDIEIRLGATHPLSGEIYVQTGNTIALVSASLQQTASARTEEWLSPSLLEDKTKIVSFRFPDFSLKQNEQGGWVRTPVRKELSSDRATQFVGEWRYARALSVGPAKGPGGREHIVVTVQEGTKQRAIEFAVIARNPELVLRRLDEGLDYRFPTDLAARLLELRPDETGTSTAPANAASGR